jgi:hypothetical protein
MFSADPPASQTRSRLGLFKIATFRGWMVLVSGPELIEDIKKAPDDILSFRARLTEVRMLPSMLRLDSYSYTLLAFPAGIYDRPIRSG